MKSRAFTLIELLVVVLIIGILSAIALPQYQKAVLKARYMQLMVLVDPLVQAQKLYYMENNDYTKDVDTLAVSVPEGGTVDNTSQTDRSIISYGKFTIQVMKNNGGVITGDLNGTGLAYLHYPSGARECRVHGDSNIEKSVCLSLGATQTVCNGCGYERYVF